MWPRLIVFRNPCVQVGLQLVDRTVHLFAERDTVEFVEHGLVESFTDAVGLRAFGLVARVIDVLDREIELVCVPFGIAAILAAAVGQHAQQLNLMGVEEWQDAVIQEIGRRDRGLAIIEFGEGNLGVGVDEGLLVDPPHALEIADVERVLGTAVARMLALELTVGLLLGLGPFERHDLGFGEHQAFLGALGLQGLEPLLHGLEVVAQPHATHAGGGETVIPRFWSSLAMRTWPNAGCSMASATMASSISCGTRFFSTGFLRLISCNANSPPLS